MTSIDKKNPESNVPGTVELTRGRPLGSISTVVRKVNEGIKSGSADVPCGSCTACCTRGYEIAVTENESTRLPYEVLPDGRKILPRNDGGGCALFIDGKCSVYSERPAVCRQYDCRVFSLAGIVPNKLAAAGFIPFEITANNKEDHIEMSARRMAGVLALQNIRTGEDAAHFAYLKWHPYVPFAKKTIDLIESSPEFRAQMMGALNNVIEKNSK